MRDHKFQLIACGKMSAVIQKQELEVATSTWTQEKLDLLKRQFCQDLTNDEFDIFTYAVRRTGLDPFMKQIYAVKRKSKTGTFKMCIQVGIDGYRLVADRTGNYAGCDDAILDHETEPNRATVTVYKMVQGQRCSFTATARWNEYYPGQGKESFMWDKMPCVMLAKVAEALALRKAFPADLSGIYTEDEMAQADARLDQKPQDAPREIKEVKAEVQGPRPVPVSVWHPSSAQWAALYKAQRDHQWTREALTQCIKDHCSGKETFPSEAIYLNVLDTITGQTDKEFMAEMQNKALKEAIKAAEIASMDRRSQYPHEGQNEQFRYGAPFNIG